MRLSNVFNLGIKELRSLGRDPGLIVLIIYAFTLAVYIMAAAIPEALNRAPIAVVDEDRSPLSMRLIDAFQPPYFLPPAVISAQEMDERLDTGVDTFALDIPPNFQRDVLGQRSPALQLNVDATRMSQAYTGSAYIQNIVQAELLEFVQGFRGEPLLPAGIEIRSLFNPNLKPSWFSPVIELINNITLLTVILTGAALIREREHGTIEHLLVMPVTPLEIMASKVWSMGLVVFVAAAISLLVVVQGVLGVPVAGSVPLFLAGAVLHLFACTSLGILLGTVAHSMPQFGLLVMLIVLPLQMLSGGITPRESMPEPVQWVMLAAPTTHYIMMAQAIIFRGAGLSVVWPQFLALLVIGTTLFGLSLARFRRAMATIG